MHHAPRLSHEPVDQPSRKGRKALALERITASRNTRIGGTRGSSRLFVTGAVVALGATSFVVANSASQQLAPTVCSSTTATIRGSSRNDVLVGTSRNDVIWAGAGDDVIYGMQGNDRLCGADGNDRIYGSSGDDYLDGGPGTDILRGDSGKRDTCMNGEQVASCESVGDDDSASDHGSADDRSCHDGSGDHRRRRPRPLLRRRHPDRPVRHAARRSSAADRAAVLDTRAPDDARTAPRTRPTTPRGGTNPNNEFPRVTGNFTGTTDEILQWAACKWGIDEDLVRAQIALESWWTMTNVGDNGESFGLGQVRVPYHGSAFEDDNAKKSSAYNVDYTYQIWRRLLRGQAHVAQHRRARRRVPQRRCDGLHRCVVLRSLAYAGSQPVHRQGR